MSEKLNEWAVFNEKNKELCEWLTQMESKVSQTGDVSIEEMMEKLRKVSTVSQDVQFSNKENHTLSMGWACLKLLFGVYLPGVSGRD